MTDPASIPTGTLLAMLHLLRETCRYGFDDYDQSVIAEIGRRVTLAERLMQPDASSSYARNQDFKSMTNDELSTFISSNVLHPENERNELGSREHLAVEEVLRRLMSSGQTAKTDKPDICDTMRESETPARIMTRPDTAGMP